MTRLLPSVFGHLNYLRGIEFRKRRPGSNQPAWSSVVTQLPTGAGRPGPRSARRAPGTRTGCRRPARHGGSRGGRVRRSRRLHNRSSRPPVLPAVCWRDRFRPSWRASLTFRVRPGFRRLLRRRTVDPPSTTAVFPLLHVRAGVVMMRFARRRPPAPSTEPQQPPIISTRAAAS